MRRLRLPILAASLVLAGCSRPPVKEERPLANQPAQANGQAATNGDSPGEAIAPPTDQSKAPHSEAPQSKATDPALPPPPPPEEPVVSEVTVTEGEQKESAFDSNAWNSAVGLAGFAGSGYGRHGKAPPSAESYAAIEQSGYLLPTAARLSTFAADVDTASFTNALRQLKEGYNPVKGSVRVEEFINAMRYELPQPKTRQTFAFETEVATCPWNAAHDLVRITVATKKIETAKVPPCNLVFLIDISGSMQSAGKLPLLKRAFGLLIDQLRPQDRVSMITYAAGVTIPIEGARGDEKERLHAALDKLRAMGGTNGAGAIQAAYDLAVKHRVAGVNRVVLATDGDFNVGIRSAKELEAFITEKKETDVFLSVIGMGRGNLKDDRLEALANCGNGTYSYINDIQTARRVLIEGFGASMMTVAKDVKLQTEWNPKLVAKYRLLGYENRALAAKDFKDDKKDGGEVGAGHGVTALYEIERTDTAAEDEHLATLRIRYKAPEGDKSREVSEVIPNATKAALSANGHVAATAAALGMYLRGDQHRGTLTRTMLDEMAKRLDGKVHKELAEFMALVPHETAKPEDGTAGKGTVGSGTAGNGDDEN